MIGTPACPRASRTLGCYVLAEHAPILLGQSFEALAEGFITGQRAIMRAEILFTWPNNVPYVVHTGKSPHPNSSVRIGVGVYYASLMIAIISGISAGSS